MSTISFCCPHCEQPFRTDKSRVGVEGTCPKCGGTIVVPSADEQPQVRPGPNDVDVTPQTVGSCPKCTRDMYPSEQLLECITCGTNHHLECWNTHQGCSNTGCTMAPPDPEKTLSRPSNRLPTGGMTLQPAMAMAGSAPSVAMPNGGLRSAKTRAEGAMASLVFGILGFFICGFVFGWAAISNANKAKQQIAADPDRYTGEGLATAGLIIGAIDIIAWAAFIIMRAGS